jgi:phenylacetate-CoA ligase
MGFNTNKPNITGNNEMIQSIKDSFPVKYIYHKTPNILKNGYRDYLKIRKMIKDTEKYSQNELINLQLANLKKLLNYAWSNINGYRKLWEQHNFSPDKLQNLEDIQLIPFVTKEILRNNINDFSNPTLKKVRRVTTGGTTGVPFAFYQEYKNTFIERAFIHDIYSQNYPDISFLSLCTTLRGATYGGIIGYDPMHGLILSSYDINLENVKKYINAIDKYRTPYLRAYPSSLYLMANIMKKYDLKIKHKFNCIMLGSEILYDFQKAIIKEIFGSDISHWYGHGENTVLAGNCGFDDRFHIYPQYGVTEIINKNGEPVEHEGEKGEIVGTGFGNYATPFIRYRTNDFAELGTNKCQKCNRNYKLLNKIEGRLQEFIVGKSGKLIALTGVSVVCGKFSDIKIFRFYQDTPGKVIFNYIKQDNVVDIDKIKIVQNLQKKLGDDFEVETREVPLINRTSSGKLIYLDQKIDVAQYL